MDLDEEAVRIWRGCRWLQLPVMLLLALANLPVPGLAWGERGHKLINAAAVENLPEPMRSYFLARKEYLVEHSIDPDLLGSDDASERPHHYTDLDADDSFPFLNLRRQFVVERAGPTRLQLPHGDSIWQIERFTLRLADSLQRRRWADADRDAIFAAHYAADLTQPLHTVMNYDGQFTGQTGVHARFETELVNALADGWRLRPQPAVFEPDLRARIFREMTESFSYRNVVFASDHIAVSGRNYLDPQYYATFYKLAGPLAKKRLEAGASFVSSLWYTAWVRAGKPLLPDRPVVSHSARSADPAGAGSAGAGPASAGPALRVKLGKPVLAVRPAHVKAFGGAPAASFKVSR